MEWHVPARIAPLQFLAYAAIPGYKRRMIVFADERGAHEIRHVAAQINKRMGKVDDDNFYHDTKKESFTRVEAKYETRKEKKIGGFTVSRKRVRASVCVSEPGRVEDLVAVKRRL